MRGFDLRAMNVYRWHPTAAPVRLDHEPHCKLSAPFRVADIEFGAMLEESHGDAWCSDERVGIQIVADGVWNAVALWYELELDSGQAVAVGRGAGSESCAVYYIDEMAVREGTNVQLRIQRNDTLFVFTSEPAQWRPRHACIPTWHYDMLNDDARNAAYERAIARAVARKRKTTQQARAGVRTPTQSRMPTRKHS